MRQSLGVIGKGPGETPQMYDLQNLPLRKVIERYGHCTEEQARRMEKQQLDTGMTLRTLLDRLDAVQMVLCIFRHDLEQTFTPAQCPMRTGNACCGHQGLANADEYKDGRKTFTHTDDNAIGRIEYGLFLLETLGKGGYEEEKRILRDVAAEQFSEDRFAAAKGPAGPVEHYANTQRKNGAKIVPIARKVAADIRVVAEEIAKGARPETRAGIPKIPQQSNDEWVAGILSD